MRTGELLVSTARSLRAIGMISLPGSLVRIEHGHTNQKFTVMARGDKKNALVFIIP